MCSYNAVNSVPSCANGPFLNDMLRAEWGFEGDLPRIYAAFRDLTL